MDVRNLLNTGTLDHRIGEVSELDRHQVPDHTRRLITACRDLDALYPDRCLWDWAHMLGFRGHFKSKSRTYSTPLGVLRQERSDYRAAQEASVLGLDGREPDSVLVLTDWQYAGHGPTPGEAALAATIARDRKPSVVSAACYLGRRCELSEASSRLCCRQPVEGVTAKYEDEGL